MSQLCSECDRKAHCRGLCKPCHARHTAAGTLPDRWRKPLPERFTQQVERDPSGCWLWTGPLSHNGYGRFITATVKNATGNGVNVRVPAHHWSISYFRKIEVPAGMQVDHSCNTPRCVNPDHLRVVTPKENNARSTSPSALNARRVECIHGHPLSGSNLYVTPDGRRQCKRCRAAADARLRAKRR